MRNRFLYLTLIALVTVGCGQGAVPGSSAPSALEVEGIRLNVLDVINFNKTVLKSGANLYIKE